MYVITHAIMAICMIGIIGISLNTAAQRVKRSVTSNLVLKVKPRRFITVSLYSKVAAFLAVFIR